MPNPSIRHPNISSHNRHRGMQVVPVAPSIGKFSKTRWHHAVCVLLLLCLLFGWKETFRWPFRQKSHRSHLHLSTPLPYERHVTSSSLIGWRQFRKTLEPATDAVPENSLRDVTRPGTSRGLGNPDIGWEHPCSSVGRFFFLLIWSKEEASKYRISAVRFDSNCRLVYSYTNSDRRSFSFAFASAKSAIGLADFLICRRAIFGYHSRLLSRVFPCIVTEFLYCQLPVPNRNAQPKHSILDRYEWWCPAIYLGFIGTRRAHEDHVIQAPPSFVPAPIQLQHEANRCYVPRRSTSFPISKSSIQDVPPDMLSRCWSLFFTKNASASSCVESTPELEVQNMETTSSSQSGLMPIKKEPELDSLPTTPYAKNDLKRVCVRHGS